MSVVFAAIIGYFLGALPTANTLARIAGVDLRQSGSGNPGANNALRLGGPGLAAAVLFTEMAKGAAATLIGQNLAGPEGIVAAGLAAAAGNLYNVFYRFKGGKGLGITAGILLVAWPTVVVPIIVVIALAAWVTHSSDAATFIAILTLAILAVVWATADLPTGWGLDPGSYLLTLALGLGVLILPKHRTSIRFRRQRPV